jgi:tetratricopeptide (TPR) repeat protein
VLDDEELLRGYLTGALAEDDAADVELRLLADNAFFDLAEAVERDVLADCARGGLAPAEEASVRRRLSASPDGQARLALAGGLTAVSSRRETGAPHLLTELLAEPVERWEALVRRDKRFHDRNLVELLIERSIAAFTTEPQRSEEPVRLALVITDLLDVDAHGAERLADLRARVWAFIANARRVKSDQRGAAAAFEIAFSHLEKGTGEALARAVVLDLKAPLLRDRRRFTEALDLLEEALRIYLDAGDVRRAVPALLRISTVHGQAGEPERSIPVLAQALRLIDPQADPQLALMARHNLITDLADMGRSVEAQELFAETRPLYAQVPGAPLRNRFQWVQGKIASGLERLAEAEGFFLAAREGFLTENAPYDVALVSLELASIYVKQGRAREVKRLAGELVTIFSSLEVHREALAALVFLDQAATAERASFEVVTGVTSFLKRARHDPDLRFREPASG